MKRYKLLKDLPTFKAGDVFYINESGHLHRESDNVMAYSWSTLDKFPNILTDWFEEIKEQTRWKPKKYHKYYYVSGDGLVIDDDWVDDLGVDHRRLEIGSCFQTIEEAKQVVEYLKALAVVRGDATKKFVRGSDNWHVYYDVAARRLYAGYSFNNARNGIFGLPYFASGEEAQRSIDRHKNEWLTIFGVEEEACD